MAVAMAISWSYCTGCGSLLESELGARKPLRLRGRNRSGGFVVLASKKLRSRKRNGEDDDAAAGYTTAALPLLDEYVSGFKSVSVGVLEKKDFSSTREVDAFLGSPKPTKVVEKSTTAKNDPSLKEFLERKLDGSLEDGQAKEEEEEEEEEDEEDEESDIVELWEGELGPMTAQEERELLAQAHKELAELKRIHGEKNLEKEDDGEIHGSQELSFVEAASSEREVPQTGAKKGVPAVMRCFDRAKIFVKAGDGGNGEVAFRREKFIPHGGPSGGNGGRGGNVFIEVDPSLNSLLSFRKSVHFRAGRGCHGLGKSQDGAFGEDCIVKVPPGTVVRDGKNSKTLLELTRAGQRELLLPGGRGGRGNAAFKSAKNKTPQLAERGEQGAEMWIDLELKLVADVGIIGIPNAGKSTLLSAISAARPTIAAYPFTTLLPNLGVVSLDFDATMVVADLPGLLEGAHAGYGLGHEFLRHTERCRVLIHVVDGTSSQPEFEYDAVRLELELFDPRLSSKPSVVAFNKMDVPEATEHWTSFKEKMESRGVKAFSMSAATMAGTSDVILAAYNVLRSVPPEPETELVNEIASVVKKERSSPIGEFKVEVDPNGDLWHIYGAGLERFTQMTNWEYFESLQRFERVLECSGVNAELKSKGIHEGDRVVIGDMIFTWHDSNDITQVGTWERGQRGSKHWPH